MESLEKHMWNDYTRERLQELHIDAPDEEVRRQVHKNWDMVLKPLDSLGCFESLIAQIGAIRREVEVSILKKAVIILCADNGIVEEGISQSGQEVTAAVAKRMTRKDSSVGRMAAVIGADTIPVDIGINSREAIVGLLPRKVRCGTENFSKAPAMTQEEAVHAIFTGIELVKECKKQGYQLIGTGEMGIGNTTTSSAVAVSLLHCPVAEVTGRGAGLSDAGFKKKKQVIQEAVTKYQLHKADALKVLMTVGGLDIAGLAGICMGGALYHIPIVLDGVISLVAALVAEEILPGSKAYLIASHKGKEPAAAKILERLKLCPVIDAKLALGEGTGAVMMMSLLDMAVAVYQDRTTFEDVKLERYTRFS